MTNINNWTELIDAVAKYTDGVFPKLSLRIKQTVRSFQKSDKSLDCNSIKKNHQEIFNGYKILYEQLILEDDIVDILLEIPSLSNISGNQIILFNMVGVGKWIKIHGGNASKIFFFDDDKTILSDKSLADFLNKINDIRDKYKYFGLDPVVYYKFKILPNQDVLDHLKTFNVVPLDYIEKTAKLDYPKIFDEKVLLDQPILLTLCSNLSFGLSEESREINISKETMIKNREDLEAYLANKKWLMNEYAFEQSKYKIGLIATPLEKEKFENLCKNITIVPDVKSERFYYLKDIELMSVSMAEREHATVVTGNQRLGNKIDTYYREIPYKIFYCAQLSR